MKRFVYATDFSENSRYVESFIKAVSNKEDVEVLLLHVFPDITGIYGPFVSQFAGTIGAWDKARKEAEESLLNWENRLRSQGINVKSKLAIGDPTSETIKEAELFKADFIAVGTRGLSGIRGFLIGSFAKSLLHSSPIPVITLRFPHIKVEKILAALDLSSATQNILNFLPKIANWGQITLYHALVVDFHLDPKEKALYEEQVIKEMPDFDGAEKIVEVSFSPTLDYAGAIVDYAERNHYDLIVVGSHGRTGIRKVVFGSVAEGIISRSHIPVLTINIMRSKV
jgi:Universal stress protein UspA and related nucleotide-binding proteins